MTTSAAIREQVTGDSEVEVRARKEPLELPSQRLRIEEEWVPASASNITQTVLKEALLDPFALCCVLLLSAWLVLDRILPAKKAPKADVVSPTPSYRKTRPSRAPDRFALVVNQRLTKLDSVDEVLDFVLTSSETGRTDIVNVVTAIHRTAKLAAGLPSLQRVRIGQDPRVRSLLDMLEKFLQTQEHSPAILSRAVGNTSWALAKLQYRDPRSPHPVLTTLQQLFIDHAPFFRPEELMNAVWAFGELRRDKDAADPDPHAVGVAKAVCRCVHKFPEFTLQQVVYFSWALARLTSVSAVKEEHAQVSAGLSDLTVKICTRVKPEVANLYPKNQAMLAWAVASLHSNLGIAEDPVHQLLAAVADAIVWTGVKGFQPGEIASILWAVNKVQVPAPRFYDLIRDHLLQKGLQGFNSQDISTILCAFVKTGSGTETFYKLLAGHASHTAADFSRSEKMMVQWAFNQLPHISQPDMSGAKDM